MQPRAHTPATRIVVTAALLGGAVAAAWLFYAQRSDSRQLVRETEEFLAAQPIATT